ncbi:MAG: right-handed parallel beta-helix repeat-containing protein, partial [Bacteroidales bacterium]
MIVKLLILIVLFFSYTHQEISARNPGRALKAVHSSFVFYPPSIQLQSPILQDTVYQTGPFEISATVTDQDGIGYAGIVYEANGGTPDTIDMVLTTGNIYRGMIPGHPYNTVIQYRVIASDLLSNPAQTQTYTFYIKKDPYLYAAIGTGLSTSNGSGPIFISAPSPIQWYMHHISLFTKEEVEYRGKIVKLHWYKGNNEGCTTSNASFKIYLKETGLTTVPSAVGTLNTELTGATLVYESTTQNLPLQTGWTEFAFNMDTFDYSGNNNLMVMTIWFPPPVATGTVVWQYTTESGKAHSWYGNTTPPSLPAGANLRPNILMTFLKPDYPTDAGVESLLSPTLSLISPTLQPVTVEIRNHGVDPLFKTGIGWSLDGILQSSYTWTGNLSEDMLSGPVTIDSVMLPFGVHRMKVWTSQPNDTTDMDHGNDTIATLICPGTLTGTYTIGTGGMFASPEAAIEALAECGISGPVTFNLLPGTYTGQWTIPYITGVNASKTITFRSATGNPADVMLLRDSTAMQNFTWNFSDALYIRLKNLTFKSTDPANGNVVVFSGNSRFIIIDSCIIEAPLGTTTTSAPIYSYNCPGYHNTVSNSLLTGGYYGVYYYGQSSYRKILFSLTNNLITDFWHYGFVSSYADSMMITGNTFRNRQGGTDFYGVSLQQTIGHSLISRNRIIYDGISHSYGIHIQSNQSLASSHILISNNFVSLKCNSGKTTYGLNPWAATTLNYYNNSIHLYGTGSASSRCVMLSNGSSLNFMNNIYSNTAGGYAFYTNSPSFVNTSNNNNFYTNATAFIQWGSSAAATLAAYKTLSGKDAASQNIAPPFVSDQDLALTNRTLSGRGAVLSLVPVDIFGSPRTPYPTIGAHEVPLLPYDAGVSAINTPTPQSVIYHGDMVPVSVQLTNFGYTTLLGCDVKYSVNNGTPVTATWSGQLQMLQTTTFSLPAFPSPYDTTTLCVYTSFPGDTG